VIKQLRPVVTTPHVIEMARELFQREAMTLGKIGSHPQLPRLLDFFELNSEFYLVQEYVAGATLQQEVRHSGVFTEPQVRHVLQEILPILTYLHGSEVIHRDIKPANILRRSIDNKLVLIDFGAVKDKVNEAMAANPQEYSTLTSFAVGTPGYAPPEQMAMRPVYASDIYALGITCIYLLTGRSPRDLGYDPKTGELLWRHEVRISDHFANILSKMLESSVKHRFQSAQELLQTVELEPQLVQLSQAVVNNSSPQPLSSSDLNSGMLSSRSSSSPGAARTRGRLESVGTRSAVNPGHPSGHSTLRRHSNYTSNNDLSSGERTGSRTAAANNGVSGGTGSNSASNTGVTKFDAARLVAAYNRGRRDFTNQQFNKLFLRKVNLAEAIFHQAQFQYSDLQQANLYNSNFGRASLPGANLKDANLNKVYMSYADLSGADLRGANLSEAYLKNANLRGTNLCGANLTGASVSEDQLALARTNWKTILPNGRRGSGL
jgi:serine/threonine-protein kinase